MRIDSLTKALNVLYEAEIFTTENIGIVGANERPFLCSYTLKALSKIEKSLQGHGDIIDKIDSVFLNSMMDRFAKDEAPHLDEWEKRIILLGKIKDCLSGASLLTHAHQEIISRFSSDRDIENVNDLSDALQMLKEHGILSLDNFRFILEYQGDFSCFVEALRALKETKLLNKENFEVFANHKTPELLAEGVTKYLVKDKRLDQQNFTDVSRSKNCKDFAWFLGAIEEPKFRLTREIRDILINKGGDLSGMSFLCVAGGLSQLSKGGILTPDNIDILLQHESSLSLGFIFRKLQKANLLTAEYKERLIKDFSSRKLDDIDHAIKYLKRSDILNKNNLDEILRFPDHYLMNKYLKKLNENYLLTQIRFDTIIASYDPLDASIVGGYVMNEIQIRYQNRHALESGSRNY
jgi:hypothetical protein